MLCRFTDTGVMRSPPSIGLRMYPRPNLLHLRPLPISHPNGLHNVIADAVGEPRVNPNSRRNLRKDPRIRLKHPGGRQQ